MREKLTYANVMATLAVVLVVAGGTAYAANTIFSTDIVNGEVKSVDIGTGQVQAIDVKNDGLTGDDIAEPTLQNVNAGTVGGLQVRKINFQVPFGTGPTTVLDLAGLQITAECQNFGDFLDVKAFTSKNDASAYYVGVSGSIVPGDAFEGIMSISRPEGRFDIGDQIQIDNATPGAQGTGDIATGTLNYSAPDGSVAVARLAFDTDGEHDTCALTGTAIGG